jgi:hypothetical protein
MRPRAAIHALMAIVSAFAGGCHTPALPLARVAPLELAESSVKLAVSHDGSRFVIGSGLYAVYLWTPPWGRLSSIQVAGGVQGAGLLEDGRIYGADRSHVELWSSTLSRRASEIVFPVSDPPLSAKRVVVSPGGRFVAIDDAVLDVASGQLSVPATRHATITAIVFAGDTHLLTAGFHDRRVRVLALPSGPEADWYAPYPVVTAAMTHDAALALVATNVGAYLWSPGSKEPLGHWGWGDIEGVCFLADERSAALLAGRTLHVIDIATLKEVFSVRLDADGTALACDGDLSAVGDDEGRVYVYEASRRQLFEHAGDLRGGVRAIAVSARARRVLALTNDEGRAQGVLLGIP